MRAAASPLDGLVDALAAAVAERLEMRLAELLAPAPAPTLLDRAGLARALGCSVSHVRRLESKGMPTVKLGCAPRYELPKVLAWLQGQA